MAKTSGGTRNYRSNANVLDSRKGEFDSLLATGDYSSVRSYFSPSGGFYITHNEHNAIVNKEKDKEDVASATLARKGYKLYLMGEKSYITGVKKYDGFADHSMMDIKTINEAGPNTIKRAIEDAAKQMAEVVVLYQNTPSMTKSYVENQLNLFREKSPKKARSQIKKVFVVGANGNVHRHSI